MPPSRTDSLMRLSSGAIRGRSFVVVLIVLNTLLALSTMALVVATEGPDRMPRLLIKFAANVGLMYGLWQGSRWIKWFFALGLFLTALFIAYLGLRLNGLWLLAPLPISVLLFWAAVHLSLGAEVDEFLRYQRKGR